MIYCDSCEMDVHKVKKPEKHGFYCNHCDRQLILAFEIIQHEDFRDFEKRHSGGA